MTETTEQQHENPLLEGLGLRRTPDPCALVIFGASGDLTHKKLLPALYALAFRRLLPPRFAIIGVARTEGDDDAWREDMKQAVQKYARDEFRQDVWDELAASMRYVATDFADEGGEDALHEMVERCDAEANLGGNRVYYLAVPPPAFPTIVEALGKRRSTTGWTRLIVEKPFGHDLASARELNTMLWAHFEEKEIFRIDHYLGKETVQNMLALRFANGIFEPIWNRQFIDHVQITVAESIGIEGRAAYYESAGAIRDIFQNHLLQMLALTAMEPPIDFHVGLRAQREGEGAEGDAHAWPEVGCARAVRARLRRGRGGARIPRGGGRRSGLDDRDVRRGKALRRQLALGGHAVLRAHGQATRTP